MRIPLTSTLESASRPHAAGALSAGSVLAVARRARARRRLRAGVASFLVVAVTVGLWWWKPVLTTDSVTPPPVTSGPTDAASGSRALPRPAVAGYWGDHRESLTTSEIAGRCPDRPGGSYLEDYPYPVGGLAMIRALDGTYTTCSYGIDQPGEPVWYTTIVDDVATDAGAIAACSRHLGYDFTGWTVVGHTDIDWGRWDTTSGDLDRPGIQRLIGLASLDGHIADCNLAYPGYGYGSVRDLDEFEAPGVTLRLLPEYVPQGSYPKRVAGLSVDGVGVVLDASGAPDARAVRAEAHFQESDETLVLPVVDGWIVSGARIDFDTPLADARFTPTWKVFDARGALIGTYP